MAFVSANIVPGGYVNESVNGVPTRIQIVGTITDDAFAWTGAFYIEGAAFAALPPGNPATEGKPEDLRFQAVLAQVAGFVKAKHAELAEAYTKLPTLVVKPAEEIAALPVITPEMLAMF
jgi:hypothetical protein